MRTKAGEEIWVRDVAVGLTEGGQQITQGVIYDITGLKRAEEGLRTRERMLQGVVGERTRELERSRLETLQRLAVAAELHEKGTHEHTVRVGRISAAIANELGLSPGFVELIGQAAPLHDIGKLGVSEEILLQPGELSESDLATMRQHTVIGADILGGSEAPSLRLAEQIALTHHERWDGEGYPRGAARRGDTDRRPDHDGRRRLRHADPRPPPVRAVDRSRRPWRRSGRAPAPASTLTWSRRSSASSTSS